MCFSIRGDRLWQGLHGYCKVVGERVNGCLRGKAVDCGVHSLTETIVASSEGGSQIRSLRILNQLVRGEIVDARLVIMHARAALHCDFATAQRQGGCLSEIALRYLVLIPRYSQSIVYCYEYYIQWMNEWTEDWVLQIAKLMSKAH